MGHVASGVNVDEPADARDDQHHDHRELVHLQIEAGAEGSCCNPGEEFFAEEHLPGVEELPHRFERAQKRKSRRADGRDVDVLVRPLRAEKSIDRRTEQRQQRNNPQVFEHRMSRHQSLSRSTRSTLSVCRLRAITMMIPRPTAASAAATTITNKTKTCPSSLPSAWLKATKAKFTALSISSMDMKMVMTLRLKMNANTPRPNKTALRMT